METVYDMLVLGGGPAGYSAALYAARAGLSTAVIERMTVGGQMTLTGDIDNYPGFDKGIDGFTLGMQMKGGAERFGAQTLYTEVTSVELEGAIKVVHTTSGPLSAKTVVIAVGAEPRRLGLEHEDALTGEGVHYCAHCDGRFYRGRTVMVVGGGNSAVSDALYLSRLADKVILVHRRDTLRASKVYHQPLQNTPNIVCLWNSTVTQLCRAADGRFDGVRVQTAGGEPTHVDCDAVFVSIGRTPSTAFLQGSLPMDEAGYLLADETTRTPIAGVFAAGDVRAKALRQVVTAAADGAVAAHFAEDYLDTH